MIQSRTKQIKYARNLLLAGALCVGSAHAGTQVFDFNSDPTATGLLNVYGSAYWNSFGGAGSATNSEDGYLVITDAGNSQRGTIIFSDFDAGQVVKAFTFEADLRIGNGHENPADGFSVNYVRANDPVLSDEGASWATGQNCEADLPEEGTRTGIAIGFDAWDSGGTAGALCDVASQSIGPDVAALTVRVDGILVSQFPLPVRNGACEDANSLQTGPYDANNPNLADGLCWAKLKVELLEDGKLNVWWKGKQMLTNYQTAYYPSPGSLVFGGRTGSNNQNQHVDNIKITTIPASVAIVGSATGHPLGFSVTINDSGNSVVDTTKPVSLKLNGADVTASSVTKEGAVTTVTYRGTAPLAAGSTNEVVLSMRDTNNNEVAGTPSFIVPAYLTLPASYKVASVDTSRPGFVVQPYQTEAANPNRLYWTDLQLMGEQGPNLGTQNTAEHDGVVDFSNTATPGSNGQFPNDLRWTLFGLPELDPDTANLSAAFMAYAHFPQAGLYTFGGNSDDGIRLTFSGNSRDLIGLEVPGLTADTGRGISANQNTGYVWIPEPGYYGFRLLFENGGGGSDLEFYTKSTPAGEATVLVNDSAAGAVKVYKSSPAAPAYIGYANPPMMHPTVAPGQDLVFRITDAANTVAPAGVTVKVNGANRTANGTKSGTVTTVRVPAPLNGWPMGTDTVTLIVTDSASVTREYSYTMTVADDLIILNPGLGVPLGTQGPKTGFTYSIHQIDRTGSNERENRIYAAEQTLFGYWGQNLATVSSAEVPGVINFDYGAAPAGYFTADNGYQEEMFPGIPGNSGLYPNDNFVIEFKTWLEFKTNGVYQLNFKSDDGFLLSLGHDRSAQAGQLEITAPASIAGGKATVWGNDAGINIASNTAPISAKIVLMNDGGPLGCGTLQNAAELRGAIALVERGSCTYGTKAKAAYEAGALAVVVGQNRPEVTPEEGWFPAVPGVDAAIGRVPLPVVMIDRASYQSITNALRTGEVRATLNPWVRSGTPVVEADYGKGADDVLQYVRVTEPGLYPFRVVYWQGGGGGNAEFVQHFTDGTRALINDATNPAAIRAFQTVTAIPRATLNILKEGNAVRINYTGTLQSADTLTGAGWTDVPGASSPYTIDTSVGARFYRARN